MGENLFKASAVYSWTDVINAWHSEVNNYEYPTGSTNGQSIGHYTQVIIHLDFLTMFISFKWQQGFIYFFSKKPVAFSLYNSHV